MNGFETYSPYISEHKSEKLTNFAAEANFRSNGLRGGTAYYLPYDDDHGVLYSNVFRASRIKPESFNKTIDVLWNLYQDGGKVAPVVGWARASDENMVTNINSVRDKRDLFLWQELLVLD